MIRLALILLPLFAAAQPRQADILVYGCTSGAVTAAIQSKKMGKSVVMVCPERHLGGLTAGGLGFTDTGNKAVIGGLSREFYQKVYQHYRKPTAWRWQKREEYGNKGQGTEAMDQGGRTMWIFEPHVAEGIYEEWIQQMKIPVVRNAWLDRAKGVRKQSGRIASITTLDGRTYSAKMFIDATYEGDLMAAAGVDYHVGRESMKTYGEKWAGIQTGVLHHRHHFGVLKTPISPYVVPGDPKSGVLPRVSTEPPGNYGDGDKKVQAYNFRMCLTRVPENRVPFPKPATYDPKEYELLLRIFNAGWRETFDKFDPIPNAKTDTNNHGPFSTDNIGRNWDYPEASYERRRQIIQEHVDYQQGWLYFIANDPRVPEEVRTAMAAWGLAKDEFKDNGNWPHQIYVREARRMVGRYVMTENELLKRRPTPEPVGMGSYGIDSHNIQRYITPEGYVQNEGDIGVSTNGPYQISYGSLVPKKGQAANLLVPVAVSSSHIAYGSIRMEPVFMILGQSAATAAAMAIDANIAVQDVPYEQLRGRLLADGQVLEYAGAQAPTTTNAAPQSYDLVVYGGTAGGVMTAVSGARQGLKTVLLEPRNQIGGMVSGGLSGTDVGRREVIGGLALEFYFLAGRRYGLERHLQEIAWMPEPKVANAIFRDMLKEAGVTLLERHRLREKTGVRKEGARVVEITTENGARFQGKIFADTSYEGDLMAQSKVSYTFGRESTQQYGESLAGVRARTPSHQFAVEIPARDKDGNLLPEVSAEPRGEPGSADKRIQAYNFRVIATNVPENRVPWPKPDNYDPKRYELLALYLNAMTPYLGRPLDINEVNLLRVIPNGKADWNNRGGFSTDYIGKNYAYPDGDYATRARIWKEHEDYQKGFYYFLANDPRVPKPLQEQMRQWGLAKDEFVDNGHWPDQLYVREGRRMVGEFVATQKDLQTELTKPDFIGMGSYNSDSHNLQRHINERGFVENEGDVQVAVKPYQIPYRVLTPKRSEATNLLVPVCFSASHIAYSSMRMEPQYMILGHAAGIAAALAISSGAAVQDISIADLQSRLRDQGAVFELGHDFQQQGLAAIRKRYAPPPRKGPVPWGYPEKR